MAYRVDVSTLQASSVDIINTIRQNASEQYQSQVPAPRQAKSPRWAKYSWAIQAWQTSS